MGRRGKIDAVEVERANHLRGGRGPSRVIYLIFLVLTSSIFSSCLAIIAARRALLVFSMSSSSRWSSLYSACSAAWVAGRSDPTQS